MEIVSRISIKKYKQELLKRNKYHRYLNILENREISPFVQIHIGWKSKVYYWWQENSESFK